MVVGFLRGFFKERILSNRLNKFFKTFTLYGTYIKEATVQFILIFTKPLRTIGLAKFAMQFQLSLVMSVGLLFMLLMARSRCASMRCCALCQSSYWPTNQSHGLLRSTECTVKNHEKWPKSSKQKRESTNPAEKHLFWQFQWDHNPLIALVTSLASTRSYEFNSLDRILAAAMPPPLCPCCHVIRCQSINSSPSSPRNKKARNTTDSITYARKSRRPSEKSFNRSILTVITVQKQPKKDENALSRAPVSTNTAEPAQFQHAHCNGNPFISLVDPFKYWLIRFKSLRRLYFGSSST